MGPPSRACPPHRYTPHPTHPHSTSHTLHPTPHTPATHTSTHHTPHPTPQTPHPTPLVGENLSCASEFALRFSIDHFIQFMTKKTFLARRKANLLVLFSLLL